MYSTLLYSTPLYPIILYSPLLYLYFTLRYFTLVCSVLCSTHVQDNVEIPSKNVHILNKSEIREASDLENSAQRPQSGPRVPSK